MDFEFESDDEGDFPVKSSAGNLTSFSWNGEIKNSNKQSAFDFNADKEEDEYAFDYDAITKGSKSSSFRNSHQIVNSNDMKKDHESSVKSTNNASSNYDYYDK